MYKICIGKSNTLDFFTIKYNNYNVIKNNSILLINNVSINILQLI